MVWQDKYCREKVWIKAFLTDVSSRYYTGVLSHTVNNWLSFSEYLLLEREKHNLVRDVQYFVRYPLFRNLMPMFLFWQYLCCKLLLFGFIKIVQVRHYISVFFIIGKMDFQRFNKKENLKLHSWKSNSRQPLNLFGW